MFKYKKIISHKKYSNCSYYAMEGGFSGVSVSVASTRVSQLFRCGCEGAPQVVLWCLSFFIWSCKWNFQKYPHWDWCFEISFKDLKEAAGKCFLFEKNNNTGVTLSLSGIGCQRVLGHDGTLWCLPSIVSSHVYIYMKNSNFLDFFLHFLMKIITLLLTKICPNKDQCLPVWTNFS